MNDGEFSAFNLLTKFITIPKEILGKGKTGDDEEYVGEDDKDYVYDCAGDEEDDNGDEEEESEADKDNTDDESDEDDKHTCRWVGDNDRYDAFMYWLSENECSDEDKKEITNSFDLLCGCFTPNKLLRSVRWSDLFSSKDIDDSILEIMRFARREKIASEEDVEREFCYLGIL